MHGLIDTQTFAVRPVEHAATGCGHLLRVVQRFEGNELRFGIRLEPLQHIGQRKAVPGHDDAPGFDTAMPVDALLDRERLQQIVDADEARRIAFAVHPKCPRPRAQRAGIARGIFLAGAELVVVVVGGDGLVRADGFASGHLGFLHNRQRGGRRRAGGDEHRLLGVIRVAATGDGQTDCREPHLRKKAATVMPDRLRRDLGRFYGGSGGNANQH
jgi:hypothetical protein